MKTKILSIFFVILIIIILILVAALFVINESETEKNKSSGFKEITGSMQSFEVFHESSNNYYPTKKYTKRYNEKLFDYLEHIQEQRDKTFHKGKVFLKEK